MGVVSHVSSTRTRGLNPHTTRGFVTNYSQVYSKPTKKKRGRKTRNPGAPHLSPFAFTGLARQDTEPSPSSAHFRMGRALGEGGFNFVRGGGGWALGTRKQSQPLRSLCPNRTWNPDEICAQFGEPSGLPFESQCDSNADKCWSFFRRAHCLSRWCHVELRLLKAIFC